MKLSKTAFNVACHRANLKYVTPLKDKISGHGAVW